MARYDQSHGKNREIMTQPILVVFGGLPATGKTTIAKKLSKAIRASYLRIDTIEQAMVRDGIETIDHRGYLIAYEVAKDNLKNGISVIADSVNPILLTREHWKKVASETNSLLLQIEIICSDMDIHKNRVDNRVSDIEGHKPSTWEKVLKRDYEEWPDVDMVIDTTNYSVDEAVEQIRTIEKLDS